MLPALLLALAAEPRTVIRVNQVGYLPDAPKVAVMCALDADRAKQSVDFVMRDERDRVVVTRRAAPAGPFGPCRETWRLDFTAVRAAGRYVIDANGVKSPAIRVGATVYDGGADTLLYYMRQQRSGFNPFFKDSVQKLDGFVVNDTGGVVKFEPVSGGWADASDYLQYVATSATATYHLLMAYRDHRGAFADEFLANGLPGKNGVPDVLDEARHGLAWLVRMYPNDREMYNQIGDDRDHAYLDLLTTDSSDYGWGKGKERPVYACTGRPQGLFRGKNRSTGLASTAGKYASAFALAARLDERALSPQSTRRIRARRSESRRVPDRAGPVAVLLRGGKLGGRHGARRGRAVCVDPRAPLPHRGRRLRRARADVAVDRRRQREALRVVSLAQRRTFRAVAGRRHGRPGERGVVLPTRAGNDRVARAERIPRRDSVHLVLE
jgi:hypothetical protein